MDWWSKQVSLRKSRPFSIELIKDRMRKKIKREKIKFCFLLLLLFSYMVFIYTTVHVFWYWSKDSVISNHFLAAVRDVFKVLSNTIKDYLETKNLDLLLIDCKISPPTSTTMNSFVHLIMMKSEKTPFPIIIYSSS